MVKNIISVIWLGAMLAGCQTSNQIQPDIDVSAIKNSTSLDSVKSCIKIHENIVIVLSANQFSTKPMSIKAVQMGGTDVVWQQMPERVIQEVLTVKAIIFNCNKNVDTL